MPLYDLLETSVTFHDARIHDVHLDYVARQASLDCTLWVGDLESSAYEEREVYRTGRLTLTGLLYFVIEPPEDPYAGTITGLDIPSDGDTTSLTPRVVLPPITDPSAFTHYFFINDWNACIFVAATGATFAWTGEPYSPRP